jgi:hypothetical protein
LSLKADFQQKWQPKMLISPGTNPLQTHFVIWLNEWVHICHLTASAAARCYGEHELPKEKGRLLAHFFGSSQAFKNADRAGVARESGAMNKT